MTRPPDRTGSSIPSATDLRPEHREHLHRSGLSDATIAEAGILSIAPEDSAGLGFPTGLSGIGFPYPGMEVQVKGRAIPYVRLRVDPACQREPGLKYENPQRSKLERGLTFYPYITDAAQSHAKEVGRDLFITEGEKKALKLSQEGFAAIGLPGVWMFTDPSSKKQPANKPVHPDLLRIRLRGRTVYVCFDSDRVRLLDVARAEDRLCGLVAREGAIVRVVRIPQPDQGKLGADDFLASNGAAAFAQLVAEARHWERGVGLLDLVPEGVPVAALEEHLLPIRRTIRRESAAVRAAVASRIAQRWQLDPPAAEALLSPSRSGSGRPRIRVDGRQVFEIVQEAWQALMGSDFGPRLALRENDVVLIDAERPRLQPVDGPKMEAFLNRGAEWVREDKDRVVDAWVPPAVVRDMLAIPLSTLPEVDQIVGLPVLMPDGRIASERGYAGRGVFVAAPADVLRIAHESPSRPSPNEVRAALSLLRNDLLGEFPFTDDAGPTHVLAAMLLPIVRPAIEGPTPLHLIDAPSAGTGKGLLAHVIHVVTTGAPPAPTTVPRSEEEMRKKITAMLRARSPVILFDNLNFGLLSDSLAAALTALRWRDRVLSTSVMVDLPNLALWILTANNPSLGRELVRRAVRSRLDSGEERPWLRSGFRHARLDLWVMQHRKQLLRALYVLVQAWRAAGMPAASSRLGSFEAWSDVVGGILENAGCGGFLEGQDQLETVDPVEAAWGQLVHRWSADDPGRRRPAKELHRLAVVAELDDLFEDASIGPSERTRFGRALAKLVDRRFGSWAVRRGQDLSVKSAVYWLERAATAISGTEKP